MSLSRSLPVLLVAAICVAGAAPDASAQARGRAGVRSGGPVASGRAVPRPSVGVVPGRPGYRPYYRGYGYYPYYPYYRPGISLGFGFGYGYPYYGYYGYGYPYYGAYGYPYGYPYGAYGYPAYGYPAGAVGVGTYGGVRIQGAPRDAEVYADGYYVGIVNDFNGVTQRLNL
ncbi:MAG TPA: hypothetical protein VGY48_06310, partial [Vicinamibacterales bacterium]|nr:hypothetical protein [Vicinamibacterales bacterium]